MNFSIGRKTVLPSQLTNRNGMFNNIATIQHNNIQRNLNKQINNKNSSQNTNIQPVSNNNNNNIIPIASNKHESVDIKTLYIFTSLYTLSIAERFSKYFSEKGIICKIVNRQIDNNDIIECENDPTLYFFIITPTVIIPEVNNKTTHHIRELPYKKYILYQTEQYNQPNIRHIDEAIISRAYAIFDYSKVNIAYYNDNIKERVVMISPFIDELPKNISTIDRPIDILFIGTLNERRNKIMSVIKHWATTNGNNYIVRVITNKFGKELDTIIRQSKIVLNLHYYPNAILEVFRIHDLLGYDCRIISELPQIPEEADLIQRYTPIVDFVPVVDEALRNIKPLLVTIITQLRDNNWSKCISGIKKSEFIYTLNRETSTGLISQIRILDPLFYKYYLGLENPYNKITYDIIKNNIDNELYRGRNKFAHLHCYDISKFREFYGTYLERIKEYFSIIVTYSIGDNEQNGSISNNILFQDFTILKIPNRGLDIGAKFCAIEWLNSANIEYEYILFLHSKRDFATREKYFKSLIDNLESIFDNNGEMVDGEMVDGYFPDIQWLIDDNKMKTISGNPEYQNMILPERNTQYRGALLQYLNIYHRKTDETQEDIFIEGNCYILSKKVANKLFSDPILYNILNTETSFDYNWVCFAYNISGSIEKVFEEFKTRGLASRNKLSYDAYIEHAFERVVLNCCDSYKLLNPILKNNIPLLNILIRTTYRPEYFTKCINSILSQIYQHYKIIICYDDVKCLEYLYNYKNNSKIEIFEVKTQDRTSQAFYNLYCNELLEKVNDGWIMFLDDDDMFYSKQALEIIAKNLYTENDILFWKVKLGNNIIYPKNINNITQFNISGEGFIFNHKFKNNAEWDNKRSGDFRFITDLLENTISFNRRFIDAIICGTQEEVINGLLGKKQFPDSFETFDQLVKYYNIKQIYISKSLHHVNDKVYIYNLTCKNTYRSLTDNSIVFFGLYTPEDIKLLYSLKNSNIFLLFGGSEVENIKHILPIVPRIHIIAISKSIEDRLKNLNVESKLLTLNLTDKNLFYPRKSTDDYIYIYDGYDKNNLANEKTYGKKYYDEVLKRFPNEKFIFSSQLKLPHEKMPEIYAKCKMGLRLTSEDGNANTVQEFEAMNIPIVHNQSDYGLKWKTVDDIIKYINMYMGIDNLLNISNLNILINTHTNLDFIAGDSIMISNYMNLLMKNNNKITLLSRYPVSQTFTRNLEYGNYTVIFKDNNREILEELDIQAKSNDIIFIRNHEILDSLNEKSYLNKSVLYGLDIHLNSIKKLDNKYLSIITQSEVLKKLCIDNGVEEDKINIIEPFAYKYDFDIEEGNDEEIRLIYCGTLRDEENILEIIEEFRKIHLERPEVVLKIVYGKIHGNKEFTEKVNKYIKEGVKGLTFKHNLSHRDACYEIATSDIGICWRKNGWGSNGEISTKIKEYEMYGLCVCNILQDLYLSTDISYIIGKKIEKNNIIILNKSANNDNLYVKTLSGSNDISTLQFLIDNRQLPESNVLLSKQYITPNYIDNAFFPNHKHIHIYGKLISHIIIEYFSIDKVNIENKYQCLQSTNIKYYKDGKILSNNIAFIGDEFTFNSLNDIVNVKYISKKDIDTIDVNLYDFLLCESTWHGMDASWKYAFNIYQENKYSSELKKIISKFKKNTKKCIFYNKEDPTNYENFYKSAELFDIIITTSQQCIDKYKLIYPDKIIFEMPFLCNPLIHNPINNNKEKIAYFVGGFYNHFPDRSNFTSKIFKDIIMNNYNLVIINRHYFFPKLTSQLSRLQQHKNKYEISEEFKQFEKPCVTHIEALNLYKNSLFHLNINTVTNCSTMTSRRLIELLGCGCNILSNPSKSIEHLELPVFTDIKQIKEYDIMNEYNIKGFYKVHTNYSYLSLLEKIFTLSSIKIQNNVLVKISCKDESKIPEKYKYLLKTKKNDFELLIQKDDYYNVEIIDKLLVYPYFFNGNVCFTHDKNKYFTVENHLIDDDCIIKYNKDTKQTLFIPHIKMLYENCFSYIPHYKELSIKDDIDTNSVFVVMCVWKRIQYLKNTLHYLEGQNINKSITLCIWNNNKEVIDEINKIINEFNGNKVKVIIHHSLENIGGIGRFILTKYVCENKTHFQNVIFIDDDQTFEIDSFKILLNNVKEKESYHWSGKKFYKDKGYWNSWLNIYPKLRNDTYNTDFNENYLDYGGTGFMIINTKCFLMDEFYKFNKKYKFIEDLWMSYFVINKLGYKLQNGKELRDKVKIMEGENNSSIAQVNLLKPLKDDFLKALREDGEWGV